MPAGAATSAGFLLGAGLRSRVGCPKTKPTDQAHANDDATCGTIRLKLLKIVTGMSSHVRSDQRVRA